MSAKTAARPLRSGFCNPGNDAESHARCRMAGCCCEHHTQTPVEVDHDPDQDPDQPPGISSYDHRLPPSDLAAARVCNFLSEFGDGRVDFPGWDGPPLFARDLQALANAALGRTP